MSSYSSKRRKVKKEAEQLMSSVNQMEVPTNSQLALEEAGVICENQISVPVDNIVYNIKDRCPLLDACSLVSGNSSVTENCSKHNQNENLSLPVQLGQWAIRNNITHSSVSELLKILNPFVEDKLPECAKTLLKTPRILNLKSIDGGKFYYFGIEKFLIDVIQTCKLTNFQFPMFKNETNILTITLSTDGIPICKSSNVTLWPILFRIDQAMHVGPFPCAIFCGASKPSTIYQFMKDLVDELRIVTTKTFDVNGKCFKVKISCFVADRPARSFVKCIKGHGAYHSCERCEDEGEYLFNRIVYSKQSGVGRTNDSFKDKRDADHHLPNLISPLTQININMISQFSLDYMHLVLLGVVKKLLLMWTSGPLKCRLPQREVQKISVHLEDCAKMFPREISRKPRSLKELCRFKATEFRHFLLYTGPCVLKNVLDKLKFKHFLLLHSAMKILLSNRASDPLLNKGANILLHKFVEMGSEIYGQQFVIFNVHGLLHLSDDALNFGNLENVSAFPFENYLYKLKRLVRGKRLQLEQIVRRIYEMKNIIPPNCPLSTNFMCTVTKTKIILENFTLSIKAGDNCFTDISDRVLILKSINLNENQPLNCELLSRSAVEFYPIYSPNLSVYEVNVALKPLEVSLSLNEIRDKCILVPLKLGVQTFLCHKMNFV